MSDKRPQAYVYRSEKVGGRSRKVYVGPLYDPVVRAIVAADALDAANRRAAREAADVTLAEYARIEPLIQLVSKEANRLMRNERKRRQRASTAKAERETVHGKRPTTPATTLTRDDFDEIVQSAATGDEEGLGHLRRFLRRHPEITAPLGRVTGVVEEHLIDVLGDDVAVRESVRIEMDGVRRMLLKGGDGPLERLVVDHIIATLLDVSIRRVEKEWPDVGASRQRGLERALDRALNRHLRALSVLSELRSARSPSE